MRDPRERSEALKRLEAVQGQMVRRGEARLAGAARSCATLAADAARLRDYVAGEQGLGTPLAKAAVKSALAIERQRTLAERERDALALRLTELRRHERVVGRMAADADLEARRASEDRALAEAMDAWLARAAT